MSLQSSGFRKVLTAAPSLTIEPPPATAAAAAAKFACERAERCVSWQATVCSCRVGVHRGTWGQVSFPPEGEGAGGAHRMRWPVASRSRSRNMCGRSSSRGMPLLWLIHSSTSRTPCAPAPERPQKAVHSHCSPRSAVPAAGNLCALPGQRWTPHGTASADIQRLLLLSTAS